MKKGIRRKLDRKHLYRIIALLLTVSVLLPGFVGSAFANTDGDLSTLAQVPTVSENSVSGGDVISVSDGNAAAFDEGLTTVSGGDAGIKSTGSTLLGKILGLLKPRTNYTPTHIFDLSQGDVSFTQSGDIITVTGFDSAGQLQTVSHIEEYIYTVMQTDFATATANTIRVGAPGAPVSKDLEIHLANVNIDAPGKDYGKVVDGVKNTEHAAAVYVNNNEGTVYFVLDDGTENTVKAYGKIFKSTGKLYSQNEMFGHAAIEKEINTNGTLVITCEAGLKEYKENDKTGHFCSNIAPDGDVLCGKIHATAVGDAGFKGSYTRVSSAAAIGSKAEVTTDSKGSSSKIEPMGTLKNLIIAGGIIQAYGTKGNSNNVSGGKIYLGGGAAIGVGAGMHQYTMGYDLENMRITGGYIIAERGDGSAACIGGGYRSGYVNIDIYGGTIKATKLGVSDTDSVRGAGIGGGGGGSESPAVRGATVNIYGGVIEAKSEFGAAIGAGAGGTEGKAEAATIRISGGKITAQTQKGYNGNGAGAAIGTGGSLDKGKGGVATVDISGGTIIASSENGADIGGGGTNSSTSGGTGGEAIVTISGGHITAATGGIGGGRANAGAGGAATVTVTGGTISGYSIGGGDSKSGNGGVATVTIEGDAVVNLSDIIGGGNSDSGAGGNASVAVHGGNLTTKAIGGGNTNSSTKAGGSIVGMEDDLGNVMPGIHITGGIINTGSIGGGSNANGAVGYASVLISGGTIRGQFVMKASSQGNCSFTMTGGTIIGTNTSDSNYNHSQLNGGAVYMDDGEGVAEISGGSIQNCSAQNGGAVYMTAGTFTLSGSGSITGCTATAENGVGGAVYLGGGIVNISGGSINGNTVLKGNGGGVYVNNGIVNMSGGSIINNTANVNGGGVYIVEGNFVMNGADALIQGNQAVSGAGVYLTGGTPLLQSGTLKENSAFENGGGIFIYRKVVLLDPVDDVNITGNKAGKYGAGVYIEGDSSGDGTDAGFLVQKTDGNTAKVSIVGNVADEINGIGGGVCINKGYFNVDSDRIVLIDNKAANGGGVAVIGGNFNLSASEISGNSAAYYGGGVLVDGGNAVLSGGILQNGEDTGCGSIINNTAQNGGGGIAVKNGNVIMSAGRIDGNTVYNGDGGGLYVESAGNDVQVMVYSGSISDNTAETGNGGAVAVVGHSGSTKSITVQVGVNHLHETDGTDGFKAFEHEANSIRYYHTDCPILNNNTSEISGGACYITGSNTTRLNMFCLVEEGNVAHGDLDVNNEHLSDFMMVAGGQVVVSTSERSDYDQEEHDDADFGKVVIKDSVHFTSGILKLYGTMDNPYFEQKITLDIEQGQGSFSDYRKSEKYVKLVYHENFKDPTTGKLDSTISVFQVKHKGDQPTVISKNLYSHDGYTIQGWYTKSDRNAPGGIWYATDSLYKFYEEGTPESEIDPSVAAQIGDLTLYAIWDVHGYTVVFHPNTGKETHLGEMDNQGFFYDEAKKLTTNAYQWPKHTFIGWNTKADGSGTSYTDGQLVSMLSDVNGDTINLYAQWETCMHSHIEKSDGTYTVSYEITEVGNSEKNIRKICDCGYTVNTILSAKDGKYDGITKYPAELTGGDSTWMLQESDIIYTAVKIDDLSVPLDPESNLYAKWDDAVAAEIQNAGYYTATIQLDKTTGFKPAAGALDENIIEISVNYTVHKAEQSSPSNPAFTPISETQGEAPNQLQVYKLEDSAAIGTQVEYLMEYYVNSVVERSEWTDYPTGDGEKLVFELESTYTNYCIYARYKGNDNYKASSESRSSSFFYYTGNTDILVIEEEGLRGTITNNQGADEGVTLTVSALPGYYINDREAISSIRIVRTEKPGIEPKNQEPYLDGILTHPDVPITPLKEKSYKITNIADDSIVTITLKGARRIPQINSFLEEGQIFEQITGDQAVISNDSAYTVAYHVTAYDTADYQVPEIMFNRDLPAATNLILKDMINNTYWYYNTGDSVIKGGEPVSLNKFIWMGSENIPYEIIADNTDLQLQLVVDFSEEAIEAGDIITNLQIKNIMNGSEKVSNAPDLTNTEIYPKTRATANASPGSFMLSVKSSNEMEVAVTHKYTSGGYASKWDHRQEVLILTAVNPLPLDAILYTNVKGYWSYIDRIVEGDNVKFVIPLGDLDTAANDVVLRLQSNMLPKETTSYCLMAQLGMAQSIAEDAGSNAEPLGEAVKLTFIYTAFVPAVKISWNGNGEDTTTNSNIGEQHVFENGECMKLLVDYKKLPSDSLFEIKASVLQETMTEEGAKVYLDTAVHPSLEGSIEHDVNNERFIEANCSVTFNNYARGNYCLMVTVTRGGYAILEAPYYFIIKDSDKQMED